MILVGDIGGTNTRLALAKPSGRHYKLEHVERYETPDDLPALVRKYVKEFTDGRLDAAALCGAGPVRPDGSIALTNNSCKLEPKPLARAAKLKRVHVVNDFAAVGHSIPILGKADLKACGGGRKIDKSAPRFGLGPGTGLGLTCVIPNDKDWVVIDAEGGHADLAPVDDEEHEAWKKLRRKYGHLCAESVLCGSGLVRLHGLSTRKKMEAPDISEAAEAGDKAALGTIKLFTRWLGRVAGNAALTLGARGGVYIAGGIIPAWGPLFDAKIFRAGFEDKLGFEDWLAAIPSFIITHELPALIGLARLAQIE